MLTCDTYLMPEGLNEALRLWAEAAPGSRLLAGGTDTLPWARQGRAGDATGDVHVDTVIDLTRVAGLDVVEELPNGRLRIGAGVVLQRFLEDPLLRAHLPHMKPCAVWFADDQIRRQATLAGNIVNASPAADGTPPMLVANAEVELSRWSGGARSLRHVALGDFVLGPGRTALEPGDMVTAIVCDSLAGYGGAFEKVGQRRSLVISTVCVSCCAKPDPDGTRFADLRMALGGIGPVPVRATEVEAALNGGPLTLDAIEAAARMPLDRVASRTRRDYRREVVEGFVRRVVLGALADQGLVLEGDPGDA